MPENDARLNDPSTGTPIEPPTPPASVATPAAKPVYQGLSLSLPIRNGEGFTVANDLRNNDPGRNTILLTRRTSEGVLEEREIPRATYERIVSGMEAKALKKGEKFPPKEKTPIVTRDEILTLNGKELNVRDYDAKRRGYYVRVLTPAGTYDEAFVERADLDRIQQDHQGKQLLTSEDRDQLRKRIFREKRSAEAETASKRASNEKKAQATAPSATPEATSNSPASSTSEPVPVTSPLATPVQSQNAPETSDDAASTRSTRSAWVKSDASEESPNEPTSRTDNAARSSQAGANTGNAPSVSVNADTPRVSPAANATSSISPPSVPTAPRPATTTPAVTPIVQIAPASAGLATTSAATTLTTNTITTEPTIRETREVLRAQQTAANELQEAKRFFTQQLQIVRPEGVQASSADAQSRFESALRATQAQFPDVDIERLQTLLTEPTSPNTSVRAAVPDIQRSVPSVSPVPTVRGLNQATSASAPPSASTLGERAGQAQINLRLRIDQANNELNNIRAKRQQNQQTTQTLSVSLVQLDPADPERTQIEATLDGLREENLALSQEEAMVRALSLELATQASELTALIANAEAANFRQPELNRAIEERLASLPTAPVDIKAAPRTSPTSPTTPAARATPEAPQRGVLERLRNRVARPLLLMSALNAGQAMDRLPGAANTSSTSDARIEMLQSEGRTSRRQKVGRYDPETGQLMAANFDENQEPLSFAEQTEAMVDTQNQFLGTNTDSQENDLLDRQELNEENETTEEADIDGTSSEETQANDLLQEQLKDQLQSQLKREAKSEATKQLTQSANQTGAKQAAKQFMDKGGNQLVKTLGWYLIPILFVWLNVRLLAPKEGSVWREPMGPLGQVGTIAFDIAVLFLLLIQLGIFLVVIYGPILLIGGSIASVFRVLSWVAGG